MAKKAAKKSLEKHPGRPARKKHAPPASQRTGQPEQQEQLEPLGPNLGKSYEDRRKIKGHLAAQRLFITKDDSLKLKAIDAEFICESHSRAARIAIKRWHRHLVRMASRTGAKPQERPEFSISVGPKSGGIPMTVYTPKEDMDRLEHLAQITGKQGMGQLIRAAVGWLYENLEG